MLPLEKGSSNVKRFATFEVDLRARELRKGGIRIRLQDQPFEILTLMLDRPGEVVSREELRQRLWPAGTFVDFEHSLNAAIKRLRAALGDDADNPRFVETLHRRGYRFIAAVEAEGQALRNLHVVRPLAAKPATDSTNLRLVVLPFANLSNDSAQEYFSDGLTEEMITQIGRLCPGRLGVIARTSSMLFKRSAKSAERDRSRAVGVDYLLEGSVRRRRRSHPHHRAAHRNADRAASLGGDLRSALGETLILQSDVAAHIARSLAMELVPDQVDVLGARRRAAPRRIRRISRGAITGTGRASRACRARSSYYERALELDPDFAAAHCGDGARPLCRSRITAVASQAARCSSRRATRPFGRLNSIPAISDAHLAFAEVSARSSGTGACRSDVSNGRSRSRQAARPPTAVYAQFLAGMSRFAEAKAEADRACDLDPLCIIVNMSAAWVRYAAGEFDESIDRCRYTLDMDAGLRAGATHAGCGVPRCRETRQAVHELQAAAGPDPTIQCPWRGSRTRRPQPESATTQWPWWRSSSCWRKSLRACVSPCGRSYGSRESRCRLCLARAGVQRPGSGRHQRLSVEPRFNPLRRDLRYSALLQRLNLQQ